MSVQINVKNRKQMFGHKSNERTLSTCWQAGQTVVQSGLGTPCIAGQFIATVRTIWVAVALFGFFDAFVCGIQTGKIPRYTVLCLKKIATRCTKNLEFSYRIIKK